MEGGYLLLYVEFSWKELFAEEDAVAGEVRELRGTPVDIVRALTGLLHTTVMHCLTTFRSTTDHKHDGGPIRL